MAVVIGSKFNPFNMQELVAPVEAATNEHNLMEQQLGELSAKNSSVKSLISANDVEVLDKYNTFTQALNDSATSLLKQGLTPSTRQNFIDLRNRYGQEILPIEQAAQTKRNLIEEQRKYKMANPSAIMSADISQMSLQDIINNPNVTYDVVVGDEVTKRVAQSVSPYSKLMLTNPEEFKNINGGQFLQRVLTTGLSPKDVQDAMSGEGPEVIRNIVQSAIQDTGVQNWSDPKAIDIITNYANRGITASMGSSKVDLQDNLDYKLAMQDLYDRRALMRRGSNIEEEVIPTDQNLSVAGYQREILDYTGDPIQSVRNTFLQALEAPQNQGTIRYKDTTSGEEKELNSLQASQLLYKKKSESSAITNELNQLDKNFKLNSAEYITKDRPRLSPDYGENKDKAKELIAKQKALQEDIDQLQKGKLSKTKLGAATFTTEEDPLMKKLVDQFGKEALNMPMDKLKQYLVDTEKSKPNAIETIRYNMTTQAPQWESYNTHFSDELVNSIDRKLEKNITPDIWEIDPKTHRVTDKKVSGDAIKKALTSYKKDKDGYKKSLVELSIDPLAQIDSERPIIMMQIAGKLFAVDAKEFGSQYYDAIAPYWNSARESYRKNDDKGANEVIKEGIHKFLSTSLKYMPRPSTTSKDAGFQIQ